MGKVCPYKMQKEHCTECELACSRMFLISSQLQENGFKSQIMTLIKRHFLLGLGKTAD